MTQDEASLAGRDETGHSSRAEPTATRPDDASAAATHPIGQARPTVATKTEDDSEKPRGRDYTSAVYGSVLAATVVVSSGDLRSPAALSVLLVVSGIVFWIAHVYAATVAGRHGGWHVGSIQAGMKHEWPVAFAAIPPAIAAAVCGLIPTVSVSDGAWAALVVAIGEQQLWGYAAVRNAKLTGPALTRTMLLNVVMGFIIVALKFGVGH